MKRLTLSILVSFLWQLSAHAVDHARINGVVTDAAGTPLCAMVLANGSYVFSCSGDGSFDLDVPLDTNGAITVMAFCDGHAPFQRSIVPGEGIDMAVVLAPPTRAQTLDMTATLGLSATAGQVNVSGIISDDGTPLCAMALANGQYTFTCGGDGSYSLDVPIGANRTLTAFGFCAGFPPVARVFSESDLPAGWEQAEPSPVNPQNRTISADNAEQIAVGSFKKTQISINNSTGMIRGLNVPGNQSAANASGATFRTLVLDAFTRLELATGAQTPAYRSSAALEQTVAGPCGGQADVVVDFNPSTSDINLRLGYRRFCMDGNILDGAITLVGRTDPYAGTLNAGITIERVTIDNPATGESFILQGEAEVTINDSGSARITENSTTTDNSTGKIYRFENLVANLSGLNDSPFVYTMAGRYYDSDHGYFTVSTPVAFEMSAYDPRPYTGVMLLVSDDGSKTRLTIIDTDAYVVDADTNGDGEYDWTSGVRHG